VRESGEPNTPLTALVGIVFAILLFVVVVLLQAYFYRAEQQENERKVVAVAPEQLSQLRTQQQELLHSYKLLDPVKGVVAIPIDVAMKLVVSEGGRSNWAQGQQLAVQATEKAPAAPRR
jgi:type II secretory pathway pseudopilin PulG